MRRAIVALLAGCLGAAIPGTGCAQTASLFSLICASSIGFDELASCEPPAGYEPPEEPRKDENALLANALAGNAVAEAVIESVAAGGAAIPYVPLAVDPCDAYLSSGGSGCSATPGASGVPGFGTSPTLNEVLTDEQEALLGCGPFYGTDCERDGIDLTHAESSVLLQSFPGFTGSALVRPGARGPSDPTYDPGVDGSAPPSSAGFASEMAALSWNYLLTLVALSRAPEGSAPADDQFDPSDPNRTGEGLCSFAQPTAVLPRGRGHPRA
jgi:hypothetical protein